MPLALFLSRRLQPPVAALLLLAAVQLAQAPRGAAASALAHGSLCALQSACDRS